MNTKTNISWTEATWNPVTGCSKVSQGCKHCYAGRIAETRLAHLPAYKDGFFNNVKLHHGKLEEPLRWRKPRMIFVNSMSDLFHENVSFEFVSSVFDTMFQTPRHIYQILTKRPKRLLEFFAWLKKNPLIRGDVYKQHGIDYEWPLPNVWLGVSVEDQKTADERIPLLLQAPAKVQFVSYEPALGPVDFMKMDYLSLFTSIGTYPFALPEKHRTKLLHRLDWVIAGGESGPKARPCNPDWIRSVRDQCLSAKVPFHFKQWGEQNKHNRLLDGKEWNEFPGVQNDTTA